MLTLLTLVAVLEIGNPPSFKRGDADADGNITVSDAVVVLLFLFAEGEEPLCLDAADANNDGKLTITDAYGVLLFLFCGLECQLHRGYFGFDPSLPPWWAYLDGGFVNDDHSPDALDCKGGVHVF